MPVLCLQISVQCYGLIGLSGSSLFTYIRMRAINLKISPAVVDQICGATHVVCLVRQTRRLRLAGSKGKSIR